MKRYQYAFYLLSILSIALPQGVHASVCDVSSLAPVQYRENSDNVRNMQNCLIQLGYSISSATGYYGNETMRAVKEYYASWYGKWTGLRFGPAGINNLMKKFSEVNPDKTFGLARFSSPDEYKKYLESASDSSGNYYLVRNKGMMIEDLALPTATATPGASEQSVANRYSTTNVQVMGIDEPDIVKNDGSSIYYSNSKMGDSTCPPGAMCIQAYRPSSSVSLINAFPVTNLSVAGKIDVQGYTPGLLLKDNNLIIMDNKIMSYDVADKSKPTEKWSIELDENRRVLASRLRGEKLYVVSSSYANTRTCPVPLLKGETLSIGCSDIYYPGKVIPVDSNYTVMAIDISSGKIVDTFSFLGSTNSSAVYMSENGLYVTYGYYEDILKYYVDFLRQNATDLIPSSVLTRLDTISIYDITNQSKWSEFQTEMDKYYSSLSNDERARIENEMNDRLKTYSDSHYRDLERTAIVRINLDDLEVASTGSVPGTLLNQFSLDEYLGVLRVATTVGGGWNRFGISSGDSVSDVYTMDQALNVIGSVKGLGTTERIYSVRFLGARGYVVTFRQVDPFYVLDLSSPNNPSIKGELKIPGYSSYLHPIADNYILGIGEESNKVKISLFDVSDPTNPIEKSKYNMDEYWTEIGSNHHAFLMDKDHQIFFVPGGEGGYIFSYKDNKIALLKVVTGYGVKRALYINDYLYIIGDKKITVLDENTWKVVKELDI
jgi:uncharacterized secreted protein with C-terminal beta-propeller domain